mgnify:CR=1 FL=1
MKKKNISIITATYNAEEHLENLIVSVIPHLSENIEFIVIDGASTDRTLEIIQKYSKFISYWESEKDNGIYDAFNKGIQNSNSEFVCFVGADDILLDNYSKTFLEAIQNNINHNYYSSKALVNGKVKGKNFTYNDLRNEMCAVHVGSLHRRSLFETVGYFSLEYKIAEDYNFLIKCKLNLKNYFIDETTMIINNNGVSNKNYLKTFFEVFLIRKKNKLKNIYLNIFLFFFNVLKISLKKLVKIFIT